MFFAISIMIYQITFHVLFTVQFHFNISACRMHQVQFPTPGARQTTGGIEGQTAETQDNTAQGYHTADLLNKYLTVNGIPTIHQKMVVMLNNVVNHDMDGRPSSVMNTALKLSKRYGAEQRVSQVPVEVRGRFPHNRDEICSILPTQVDGMEIFGRLAGNNQQCHHVKFQILDVMIAQQYFDRVDAHLNIFVLDCCLLQLIFQNRWV